MPIERHPFARFCGIRSFKSPALADRGQRLSNATRRDHPRQLRAKKRPTPTGAMPAKVSVIDRATGPDDRVTVCVAARSGRYVLGRDGFYLRQRSRVVPEHIP